MTKRKGSSTSGPRTRSKTAKEERDAKGRGTREVQNAKRLDKLPREVYEKILDELEEDDLFPLALSCKYFRQKQVELVEQTRQDGPGSGKPRRTLKTNLRQKLDKGQSASAEYLEFCSQEKVSWEVRDKRDDWMMRLAAYHGHLPLLRDLLQQLEKIDPASLDRHSTAAWLAGESSSSLSPLLVLVSDSILFSLSIFLSARGPAGDPAVAESPQGDQAG